MNSLIGAGIHFYKQSAGDAKLSRLQAGFSISSMINVDYYTKLSLGLQGSFNQHSYNASSITWDSQFNGVTYDPTLSSFELFNAGSNAYFNLGIGGLWKHYSRNQNVMGIDQGSFQIGVSSTNLLRSFPKFSE